MRDFDGALKRGRKIGLVMTWRLSLNRNFPREAFDAEPAGDFSAVMPSHSVGDRQQQARAVDPKNSLAGVLLRFASAKRQNDVIVLIVAPAAADVRVVRNARDQSKRALLLAVQ
jgi:hypothetical protein